MRWGRANDKELRARLAIPRTERILATGRAADAGSIAATDRALYVGGERLPWTEIERAAWTDPGLDVVGVDGRALHVELVEEGMVPQVVHAQIDASIVAQHRLDLGGGLAVLAVARRTDDGSVAWRMNSEEGTDLADPAVAHAADAALAVLRESLGI